MLKLNHLYRTKSHIDFLFLLSEDNFSGYYFNISLDVPKNILYYYA